MVTLKRLSRKWLGREKKSRGQDLGCKKEGQTDILYYFGQSGMKGE